MRQQRKRFFKRFCADKPVSREHRGFEVFNKPAENPQYAFSENDEQMQPRVSIILTVEPNPEYMSSKLFKTITIENSLVANFNAD